SRRRPTMSYGDWSSDVCSSDLIELGGARRLSVPASAVLDAGSVKTVFLDRGNGHFEPRQVTTGARFTDAKGDRVEIISGLKAGEIGRASCRERGSDCAGESVCR